MFLWYVAAECDGECVFDSVDDFFDYKQPLLSLMLVHTVVAAVIDLCSCVCARVLVLVIAA